MTASELRTRVALQQAARATRLRADRADAGRLAAAAKAAAEKRAREAAEKARPSGSSRCSTTACRPATASQRPVEQRSHRSGLRGPLGTPIRAVGDGKIISAGWDGSYGQKIVILHADGTETWYAHMSSFVRTGGFVKAGDVIGRVWQHRQRDRSPPALRGPARRRQPGGAAGHGCARTAYGCELARATDRLTSVLELLHRRVAQQQPLDTVAAEVDRRHGLARPTPSTDTTVPMPNVSWVTRSPGSRWITTRLPGDRRRTERPGAAMAGVTVTVDSAPAPVDQLGGTSSRNRDGGLNCGAPHALRTAARLQVEPLPGPG